MVCLRSSGGRLLWALWVLHVLVLAVPWVRRTSGSGLVGVFLLDVRCCPPARPRWFNLKTHHPHIM